LPVAIIGFPTPEPNTILRNDSGLIRRSVARIPLRSMMASLHMNPVPPRSLGDEVIVSIAYFPLTIIRSLANWQHVDR
jgi:hypothetical protein